MLICVCFSSCQRTYQTPTGAKTYQKPIDLIYVYHEAFGKRFPEYKIDIKNKQFLEFISNSHENFVARDASSKNEGFTLVSSLSEDKIETFILESSRNGFTKWKDTYENNNILDGHQWGIIIMFSDSTQKTISGSNQYPETWNKMYDVFEKFTGKNILLQKNS
jgi:hypothetical protein